MFLSIDEITAIDSDTRFFEKAKQQFPRVNFIEMDAYKIDFPAKSFDLVSVSNSLHHFKNPPQVLAQIYRVLKPGGIIICSEMVRDGIGLSQKVRSDFHNWISEIDMLRGMNHFNTLSSTRMLALMKDLRLASLDYQFVHWDEIYPNTADKKQTEACVKHTHLFMDKLRENTTDTSLIEQGKNILARLHKDGAVMESRLEITGVK